MDRPGSAADLTGRVADEQPEGHKDGCGNERNHPDEAGQPDQRGDGDPGGNAVDPGFDPGSRGTAGNGGSQGEKQ